MTTGYEWPALPGGDVVMQLREAQAALSRVDYTIAARVEAELRQAGQDFLAECGGAPVRPVFVRRWLQARANLHTPPAAPGGAA